MAAVVLVLTFGSLLVAGLPLLTALLGVGVGALVIRVLAAPLGLGSTTTGLATMIGLAVGIDYALFVPSRYRAELARGRSGDLPTGEAVRVDPRGGDDRDSGHRVDRPVARVGPADQGSGEAQRGDDVGGGREQGHDAHDPSLGRVFSARGPRGALGRG